MKVALYARVSTEDQAKHGISIEAQLAALERWAEENHHTIVGTYVDPGVSGQKPYKKRPDLCRFMDDLEAGLQVDALVFTKLDRFFRSVKLYYQAVDILDRHKVAWAAIHEDYETVTANGKFKVNIMLAVNEQEASRTGERIKTVFEYKIANGEAVTRCQPFGYSVRNKKVVPDEYAPAAKEMFEFFAETGNTFAVRNMIQEKYGVRLNYESVYRFLQNPIYVGRYRDNDHYCEPIVSRELFEQVQRDFAERRKTKKAPSGRVYLFSGLLVCKSCGRKLIAGYNSDKTLRHPEYYRCNGHLFGNICPFSKNVKEYDIEQALLTHIGAMLDEQVVFAPKPPRQAVDSAAVEKKIERLKELYIEGDIEKEKYLEQRDKLSALLVEPKPPRDFSKIVTKSFREEYEAMTREQRRSIWRSIIDHIDIDLDKNIEVYFLT